MSFYESSRNIWLEDGHILHAECAYGDDEWNESTIDLNDFVGNSDGWFVWNGVNFSESAGDISVDGAMLTAELNMIEEGTRGRQGINLNDRIGNDNGRLVYINQDD
ncbi:hypothetical protein MANI_003012 [Metarhizium anisopliae]